MPQTESPAPARVQSLSPITVVANVVRGSLIGMAELVPGVSGGTLALITGVYERLIGSANQVLNAVRRLVTGPERISKAREELSKVEWGLLIPLLVGMGLVVVTMAGVMKHFMAESPQLARGLFLGMVAASVVVPLLEIKAGELRTNLQRLLGVAVVVLAAALAFWMVGSSRSGTIKDPSMILVFCAAAVAICALALPGVSGSFFLLTIGLYETTMGAVSDRNLGYLAVFASGAVFGLASFVKLLEWVLKRYHTITMLAMAGLMLGSLRALWPWQSEDGQLLAIGEHAPAAFGLAVLGAVVVVGLVWADRVLRSRTEA